jgi:hypothetical protein
MHITLEIHKLRTGTYKGCEHNHLCCVQFEWRHIALPHDDSAIRHIF